MYVYGVGLLFALSVVVVGAVFSAGVVGVVSAHVPV